MPHDAAVHRLRDLLLEARNVVELGRKSLSVGFKPDGSVVTNCDREVELFLRPELQLLAPGAHIWGEEFGNEGDSPNGLWLIDPIDGTTNFSNGSPLWGISAALCVADKIVLGGVYLPDLDDLIVGSLNGVLFAEPGPVMPPQPGPVRDSDPVAYNSTALRHGPNLGKMRSTGSFVVDGMFLIRARYRALVGMREKLYDIAGCLLLARMLGYQVQFADGSEFRESDWKKDQVIDRPWTITPPV